MIPWVPCYPRRASDLSLCQAQCLDLVHQSHLAQSVVDGVIMPSLVRVHDWLLDLPVPTTWPCDGGSVCDQAWHEVRQLWGKGVGLDEGMGYWLERLYQGLGAWRVWALEEGRRELWGGFSIGLKGWCQAKSGASLWLEPVPRSWGGWCTSAHWVGRVLAGESWRYLEHSQVLSQRLSPDNSPVERCRPWVEQLLREGIWDPSRKPGKLWRDRLGWWWLWPLALHDLHRQNGCKSNDDCSDDEAYWQRLGVLDITSVIEQRMHPLLGRMVQCVRPTERVQGWLDAWFPLP